MAADSAPWRCDATGNLLSDGARTLTYDAEHRLASVTSSSVTVSYGYDPDGKRIRKAEQGAGGTQVTVYIGRHYEREVPTPSAPPRAAPAPGSASPPRS